MFAQSKKDANKRLLIKDFKSHTEIKKYKNILTKETENSIFCHTIWKKLEYYTFNINDIIVFKISDFYCIVIPSCRKGSCKKKFLRNIEKGGGKGGKGRTIREKITFKKT